jgi:hypothetical protein
MIIKFRLSGKMWRCGISMCIFTAIMQYRAFEIILGINKTKTLKIVLNQTEFELKEKYYLFSDGINNYYNKKAL